MSILFASLESTDVKEIDEEDPESNQTGKSNLIVKMEYIRQHIFIYIWELCNPFLLGAVIVDDTECFPFFYYINYNIYDI